MERFGGTANPERGIWYSYHKPGEGSLLVDDLKEYCNKTRLYLKCSMIPTIFPGIDFGN